MTEMVSGRHYYRTAAGELDLGDSPCQKAQAFWYMVYTVYFKDFRGRIVLSLKTLFPYQGYNSKSWKSHAFSQLPYTSILSEEPWPISLSHWVLVSMTKFFWHLTRMAHDIYYTRKQAEAGTSVLKERRICKLFKLILQALLKQLHSFSSSDYTLCIVSQPSNFSTGINISESTYLPERPGEAGCGSPWGAQLQEGEWWGHTKLPQVKICMTMQQSGPVCGEE